MSGWQFSAHWRIRPSVWLRINPRTMWRPQFVRARNYWAVGIGPVALEWRKEPEFTDMMNDLTAYFEEKS